MLCRCPSAFSFDITSFTKAWNLHFVLVSHWASSWHWNLHFALVWQWVLIWCWCWTQIWILRFVLVSRWVLIWRRRFAQNLDSTLCYGVALGLDLVLEFRPTPETNSLRWCCNDLRLTFQPKHEARHRFGFALNSMLKVLPKPGAIGPSLDIEMLTKTWSLHFDHALVSHWALIWSWRSNQILKLRCCRIGPWFDIESLTTVGMGVFTKPCNLHF